MKSTPLRRTGALARKTPLKRTKRLRPRSSHRGGVTREEHNRETAAIRAEVMKRANGKCECGCGRRLGHSLKSHDTMDHYWGRRDKKKHPQSARNCWALRLDHHECKTNSDPSPVEWATRYLIHSMRCGHADEVAFAKDQIEALEARLLAREVALAPYNKPAFQALCAERQPLILKKYEGTQTDEDRARLAEIEAQLDGLEKPYSDMQIARLERHVDRLERIGKELRRQTDALLKPDSLTLKKALPFGAGRAMP